MKDGRRRWLGGCYGPVLRPVPSHLHPPNLCLHDFLSGLLVTAFVIFGILRLCSTFLHSTLLSLQSLHLRLAPFVTRSERSERRVEKGRGEGGGMTREETARHSVTLLFITGEPVSFPVRFLLTSSLSIPFRRGTR